MPTFVHGKNTIFSIANASATPTDISNVLNDVNFPETVDSDETSAFGNSSKTYVVGLKDGKISIKGTFDATVDGVLSGILGLATASAFIYGPQGSTTGYAKYTGSAFLTSYDKQSAIGGVSKFSAEFIVTGDVTHTVY